MLSMIVDFTQFPRSPFMRPYSPHAHFGFYIFRSALNSGQKIFETSHAENAHAKNAHVEIE
jgi:hypothetical protein